MRRPAALPTPSPLPLRASWQVGQSARLPGNASRGDGLESVLDVNLTLRRFNDVLHSIHPDAPHLDAEGLADVALWLLDLPPAQARRELHQRLARLRELRRMADDVDWDTDLAQRARLQRLLVYIVDPNDLGTLIEAGDRTPRLGRLDDALLVELAWPAFADELEDYLDFCRFRHEQHPLGAPPLKRSAWVKMRLAEGALWQRMQRVHPQSHAHLGPGERELRVR